MVCEQSTVFDVSLASVTLYSIVIVSPSTRPETSYVEVSYGHAAEVTELVQTGSDVDQLTPILFETIASGFDHGPHVFIVRSLFGLIRRFPSASVSSHQIFTHPSSHDNVCSKSSESVSEQVSSPSFHHTFHSSLSSHVREIMIFHVSSSVSVIESTRASLFDVHHDHDVSHRAFSGREICHNSHD